MPDSILTLEYMIKIQQIIASTLSLFLYLHEEPNVRPAPRIRANVFLQLQRSIFHNLQGNIVICVGNVVSYRV